jgi:serralysin
MPAPTVWSPEQLVNTTTFGDQSASQVTALEGGGYVVVWSGMPGAGSFVGIYAQVYDAFGEKVGGQLPITSSTPTNGPDVAALPGGGFTLVWQGWDEYGSSGAVGRTFDAAGQATGSFFTANGEDDPNLPDTQYDISITALDSGGFAVAYVSSALGTQTFKVQRLDDNGNKVGAEIVVGVDAQDMSGGLTISSIGGNRFAVAWHGPDGDYHVYARVYDDSGNPVTGAFPVTSDAGNHYSPSIGADGSGNFLVVFTDNALGTETFGQLYTNAGLPIGTALPISDVNQNGQAGHNPDAIGLDGGGYFVVWLESSSGTTAIVGQLLDGAGNKVGTEFVVKQSPAIAFAVAFPSLAQLADGRIAVSWEGKYPDGADMDMKSVHTVIVDPRGGIITGTDDADFLLGSGGSIADTIIAKEGNDEVLGLGGNDTIEGNGGNDTLDGGTGADSMQGGRGDDLYYVDSVADIIVEAAGAGTDTVVVQGLDYTLAGGHEIEVLQVVGDGDYDITGNEFGQLLKGDASNNKLMGMGGNDTLDGGTNVDYMEGGTGDDLYLVDHEAEFIVEAANGGTDTVQAKGISFSLIGWDHVENLILTGNGNLEGNGNERANTLTGNAFDNALFGQGGNDTLDGLAGADTMKGGSGADTYIVGAGDIVIEVANEGFDTVVVQFDYTLGANVEALSLLAGTNATGNDLANAITGNAGANVIDGKAGNDTMTGGLGDDHYIVTDGGDSVVEAVSAGFDTVTAYVDHALAANVEKLALAAGSNATGNGLANIIEGNAGANVLDGQGGNDTMTGFAGDDTYVVADAGDGVVEAANGGTDTVIAMLDYTLGSNVEKLALVAGFLGKGNELANTIDGNAGANLLDGQGGIDTMAGGLGDDGYVVADLGDAVVEGAGAGFDTVHAGFNYTLGANFEGLVLTGTAAKGTGNDAANSLLGNAGANTLSGGKGNDTLDGGGSKDSLDGGKGNDTYVLGNSGDKVTDSGGADDTITSTVTRKLAAFAGIENLTLVGAGNVNGAGTGAANDLIGNAGKNQLKGEGGNDLLRGGTGKDQLWGGAGKDSFDFNGIAEIGKSSSTRDVVKDFQHLSDKIDLSTIDANALTSGNGKFKFIAAEGSKFKGIAGQLIWDQKDVSGTGKDLTLVSGDINGDKVADFTLELTGLVNLTNADFIL